MLSRILWMVLIFVVVLIGCNNSRSGKTTEKETGEERGDTSAKISFEQVFYDFGNIKQGEKVTYSFQFRNTGESPLVIEDAFASCGCTVPEFDKEPIAPGKEGYIEVIFDSSGRRGSQYKTVMIKTNSPDSKHRLTIKANVLMN